MVLSQNTLTYKLLDSRTIFVYLDNPPIARSTEDQYQQTFYLSHADVGEVNQILNQMLTTTTAGNRPVITQNKIGQRGRRPRHGAHARADQEHRRHRGQAARRSPD